MSPASVIRPSRWTLDQVLVAELLDREFVQVSADLVVGALSALSVPVPLLSPDDGMGAAVGDRDDGNLGPEARPDPRVRLRGPIQESRRDADSGSTETLGDASLPTLDLDLEAV